jgi:hypothetical protein
VGSPATSYSVSHMGSFSGVKKRGREADHLPHSSVEIKNEWRYTYTPLYLYGFNSASYPTGSGFNSESVGRYFWHILCVSVGT